MSEKKLTKWEAGSEIVKAADALSYCANELSDFPEIQREIRKLRQKISKIYTDNNFVSEMGFGI